ncbi:solute carrier family 41 member 3 isoform X2 [Hippopotamus amphibius kiboko]|uniref:solute carrier family 41 member 3 isoform X2 n=1 Tax=Hippopotamus amphibius kiboko TaxID=575201 RepID=UPI0025997C9B|nr:solute carrier family 41 member 3 isoform X2 [Hippopotamus amphibius kiboko]
MDGTETRQRRLEELGLLHALSTGRLPTVSEDGLLSVPESQRAAPKPLGPELSGETALSIGLQVTVPFLLAGLGLSGAGILLNYFQHWPVFTEVKDLLTLVPPLVGLKGNLEMTLASRLSTAVVPFLCEDVLMCCVLGTGRRAMQLRCCRGWAPRSPRLEREANTGQIDDPREQHRVVGSNLALIQVQATVVGLLAAVAALLLGAASGQELDAVEAEVLCASSVVSASLAAFALVIGARKLGVNPDNVATPIAASLGDLITLSLLALVSSFFHRHRDSQYLTPLVCVGFAALTPVCVLIAKQNPPVVRTLKFGWFPIVLAMLLSSLGGLTLNKTISKQPFQGMAVFAPVICGVGGNLVAIQTSRVSTRLHLQSTPGVLPLWMKKCWPNPRATFCSSETNSASARVLLLLVVPGHLLFFSIIYLVEGQSVPNDRTFVLLYLLAALLQVTILLYLAEVTARLTWHQALDPDDHCIPYLTGLGDLLGTGLLTLCFLGHWLLRDEAGLDGTLEPAPGPS